MCDSITPKKGHPHHFTHKKRTWKEGDIDNTKKQKKEGYCNNGDIDNKPSMTHWNTQKKNRRAYVFVAKMC